MKTSNNYLIAMAVIAFIVGLGEILLGNINLKFIVGVANTILVFGWCKAHAIENNKTSFGGYRIFAALFPIIGVPVYLFKFFGFKHGVIKLLKAVLFAILTFGLLLLPSYADKIV